MRNICKKNIFTISICLFLSSCSVVEKIPPQQNLLAQNKLEIAGGNLDKATIERYYLQTPNKKILGLPLGVFIYNLANEQAEENYQQYLEKHPKMKAFLVKLLSEKQIRRLGASFLVAGKERLLMKIGSPAVVVDSSLTKKTANTIAALYQSNGYFNAQTDYKISTIPQKTQQASVSYSVKANERFYIDSISASIASPEIEEIYNREQGKALLKKGQPYQLKNLSEERTRLTNLFRNNGFYNFDQSSITFDVARNTDTPSDTLVNISLIIARYTDRSGEYPQKKPYITHRIGKVKLHTDYDFTHPDAKYDSINYNGLMVYYQGKQRYRLKTLSNAMAIRSGEPYSDFKRSITLRQFSNLRTFRYPTIAYELDPTDPQRRTLDVSIYLNPLSRFSIEANIEAKRSSIQEIGVGGDASLLFRNVFGGAETLQIIGKANVGSQNFFDTGGRFFDIFEYGADVRLSIPRILFFLNTDRLILPRYTPQTLLQIGTSFQENIGLDKNKITGLFRYQWNPKFQHNISLDLLDVEYVHNKNPENFFSVYRSSYDKLNQMVRSRNLPAPYTDEQGNLTPQEGVAHLFADMLTGQGNFSPTEKRDAWNLLNNMRRITRNDLVVAHSFTFIWNNSFKYAQERFEQARFKIELAGVLPSLYTKMGNYTTDEQGNKEIFGVTYAQYIKGEGEYIRHWPLGKGTSIALRGFVGLALPYGNATSIPFSRSYFAGGANDNRAWRAYALGVGSGQSFLEFNEANFKLLGNVEYRFPLYKAFKGAVFADVGNIWYYRTDVKDTKLELDSLADLKDLALGTGIGLRYDFDYFVFRIDFGVKTYDPSREKPWISNFQLRNFTGNIGVNYPF